MLTTARLVCNSCMPLAKVLQWAMAYTVELDEECRIQIPASLRESLHLAPGSQLQVERDGQSNRFVLSLSTSHVEPFLEWHSGVPVIMGGKPSALRPVDQIEYMRAERAAHVMGPPSTATDFLRPENEV